jgi:hypothetical protein
MNGSDSKHEIRCTIHDDGWWFVIADVVVALIDSVDLQGYLKDMRRRDPELARGQGRIVTPVPSGLPAASRSSTAPTPRGFFVFTSKSMEFDRSYWGIGVARRQKDILTNS